MVTTSRSFRKVAARAAKILIISGLGIVTFGMVGCKRHKDPNAMIDRGIEHISSKFELETQQKAKLAVLGSSLKETLLEIKNTRADTAQTLRKELASENINAELVTQKLQGLVGVVSNSIPKLVSAFADFHASLNAEQRKMITDRTEKFMSHSE